MIAQQLELPQPLCLNVNLSLLFYHLLGDTQDRFFFVPVGFLPQTGRHLPILRTTTRHLSQFCGSPRDTVRTAVFLHNALLLSKREERLGATLPSRQYTAVSAAKCGKSRSATWAFLRQMV